MRAYIVGYYDYLDWKKALVYAPNKTAAVKQATEGLPQAGFHDPKVVATLSKKCIEAMENESSVAKL